MKSQGLAAPATASEGTVTVQAKENHGAHTSLPAGPISKDLDTNQGGPWLFVCNFPEVYYFPKPALAQPGLKLLFHPPYGDFSHCQANVHSIQTAFCFSISSCFPWFSSSHWREWQTCPRAVYLTLTFTPRLRSENEKWHHPVNEIWSTSAIHRPK